jgi:transposase
VTLEPKEEQELLHIAQSGTEQARYVQRARIVLLAHEGLSNQRIAEKLGMTRKVVARWRQRYVERRFGKPDRKLKERLADCSRSGAPSRISAETYVDLLALATTDPQSLGLPFTQWSRQDLTNYAIEKKVVKSIHPSTVGRFLAECDLKPHRVRGWMNRKDDPEFPARAEQVKQVLSEAVSPTHDPTHAVVSFDEKTGIQALERVAQDHPIKPGRPVKQEYEYRRHGTLCLLAWMLVSNGHIFGLMLPRRTNEDTAAVIHMMLGVLLMTGVRRITVVLDNLNTHLSLEVLEVVARLCHLPLPAPELLETLAQRRAWLEDPGKPIVFCFTPKHASWLNPIEVWFGVLCRKALRRGSFRSVEELREKIEAFRAYYNERMAHPYRLRPWTASKATAL